MTRSCTRQLTPEMSGLMPRRHCPKAARGTCSTTPQLTKRGGDYAERRGQRRRPARGHGRTRQRAYNSQRSRARRSSHQFGAFPIVCRALASTETCAHFCDKTRSVLFQFASTRNLPPTIIAAPPPVAPVPAYACIVPHVRGECAAALPRRTPTEVQLLLEAQCPRLFPLRIWQGSHLSNLHPDSWRTAPLRTLAAFGQHPSSQRRARQSVKILSQGFNGNPASHG